MTASTFCSTVRRRTRSCGLTSEIQSGREPLAAGTSSTSMASTLCLPPVEEDASRTSPCSASQDPPPRPWPFSVLLRCGATSWPGPERRTSAHAATWSGAVALCVAGQHSSRAASWGPSCTCDTSKKRRHA